MATPALDDFLVFVVRLSPQLNCPIRILENDDVLLELGLDWDRIIELKTAGAVT